MLKINYIMKTKIILFFVVFTVVLTLAQAQEIPTLSSTNELQIEAKALFRDHSDKKEVLPKKFLPLQNNSDRNLTWNWDCIIAYDTTDTVFRDTQTFDPAGKTLTINHDYKYDQVWHYSDRWEYTYDEAGNLSTKLFQFWRDSVWENNELIIYSYDSCGRLDSILVRDWLSYSNRWDYDADYTYTYDQYGNVLTETGNYYSYGAIWRYAIRVTYTYNTDGNILTELIESGSSDGWYNNYCYFYTYDLAGNLCSILGKKEEYGEWINDVYYSYSFDALSNSFVELIQYWNSYDNEWLNDNMSKSVYDRWGNLVTCLKGGFDENDIFMGSLLYSWTYDQNGNSVTGKMELFNRDSEIWMPYESDIELYYNHSITHYVLNSMAYRYEASYVSYNTTGIEESNRQNIAVSLYPNPASDKVTIQVGNANEEYNILIYNSLGHLVKKEKSSQSIREIGVSGLSAGLYIVDITGKDFFVKKKLIISR